MSAAFYLDDIFIDNDAVADVLATVEAAIAAREMKTVAERSEAA
jgi:hypothetical protein